MRCLRERKRICECAREKEIEQICECVCDRGWLCVCLRGRESMGVCVCYSCGRTDLRRKILSPFLNQVQFIGARYQLFTSFSVSALSRKFIFCFLFQKRKKSTLVIFSCSFLLVIEFKKMFSKLKITVEFFSL